MRALVTGGKGFVGRWLTAHLSAEGDDVKAIDREIDVTDTDAVSSAIADFSPDVIYHLAGLASVGGSWDDPAEFYSVNALGTLSVLEGVRKRAKQATVLLVSSAEVYGAVAEADLPISESQRLAPVSPYAASKVSAEYMAIQAGLAYGTKVVRIRPFNHIGPGQGPDFVVPALASRIRRAKEKGSKSIPVGNLSARRDLTDVRDIVRAYRLLAVSGSPGEVYNVCSGKDIAISEVALRLMQLADVDLELVEDPELFRPIDVPVIRGDSTCLGEATGWKPELDISQTLADVLKDSGPLDGGPLS